MLEIEFRVSRFMPYCKLNTICTCCNKHILPITALNNPLLIPFNPRRIRHHTIETPRAASPHTHTLGHLSFPCAYQFNYLCSISECPRIQREEHIIINPITQFSYPGPKNARAPDKQTHTYKLIYVRIGLTIALPPGTREVSGGICMYVPYMLMASPEQTKPHHCVCVCVCCGPDDCSPLIFRTQTRTNLAPVGLPTKTRNGRLYV